MPRTAKSQISFADWELLRQGLSLQPFLQTISDFLEDHEEMIEAVRRDLQRGLKNPQTGRNGLTPSQVLRSFVLKSVKSWDLRELRERIADGYTLRQFTEFYCQPVPKHHAFNRAFHRLTPETVKAINELVVNAAVDLGLEDGNRLRVDTTVVQTDIHHPTDNTLLWDVVRVVTRLVGRLKKGLYVLCHASLQLKLRLYYAPVVRLQDVYLGVSLPQPLSATGTHDWNSASTDGTWPNIISGSPFEFRSEMTLA